MRCTTTKRSSAPRRSGTTAKKRPNDGEEETETVNRIEGVLRVDGVDYPMSGFSEISAEGDESEREHELRVDMGDGKSLVVEQEIENERDEQEQEYVYSVYDGRRLVEQSVFSFEQERDETEIELEQRVRGEDGSMTTTLFSFEKEIEHGKEVIRLDIRGNGGNVRGSYIVSVETAGDGTSGYVYTRVGGDEQHRFDRHQDRD